MKRITAFFLTLILISTLVMTSCTTDPVEPSESKQNAEETLSQTEAPTEAQTETPAEFTNVVAVDNDDCKVEITGIESDIFWGYTLNVYLENKSADKTYAFVIDNAAINGVEVEPMFYAEVASGKKANESISFADDELDENGITKYTDIELTFRVYDSNDWSSDDIAVFTTHVYPYGEENATTYVRESKPSDTVVVDNEYATFVVLGYEEDEIWGYTANIFIINKTDKEAMFSIDEVSVNGFMIDPFFAKSLQPGKCAFSNISWSDSEFESNGISNVEEIEFVLHVYDSESWFDEAYIKERITLNP